MKRILILTLIVLAASTCAEAQKTPLKTKIKYGWEDTKKFVKSLDRNVTPTGEHDQWDLYVNPKLGLGLSTMTGIGADPKIGVIYGVGVEVFALPNLSANFEMSYSKQGANNVKHTNSDGETGSYDYSLSYLNTYYLARWYPYKEKPLSVYAGLHFYRLMKARARTKLTETRTITDAETGEPVTESRRVKHTNTITDDLRRGDVTIPIGVSYEVGQWQFDLRYDCSFIHLDRSARAKRLFDGTSNQLLSLTAAYKILVW